MVTQRHRRFAIQTLLVARIYAGYKFLQTLRRLGMGVGDSTLRRQHRRSAESIYDMATRLEGLPVKVCQFIGSRADVLPDEFIEILSKLQDHVPPRPFETLRPMVEAELGQTIAAAFAEFETQPIASASLAQVHRARLHDGRIVAVKIQYPEIAGLVASDLRNFAFLIGMLARLEPNFDFRVIIDEVQKLVPLELDFLNEADNAERMARCFAERTDVFVPPVVRELSTRRVLVSEFAPGVRATDLPGLAAQGVDPLDVARLLTDVFCEMILKHGFFHGDPHPGNILIQPGPRMVLLDFGLAKEFAPGFREGITRLVVAIMQNDRTEIAASFRALGFRTRDGRDDESLAMLGEVFLGWAIRTGRAYANAELMERFNTEVPEVMKKNPLVEIPGDILLVGRVMGLLSGISKQLGSDVDPGAALLPYLAGMSAPAPA
jgi:predicted unusual protein kinase regulating ubiquinone biosynthesis (AarF/ABC1/UbiB family)